MQPNNRQKPQATTDRNKRGEIKHLGSAMIVLAMIITLGLLTQFFQKTLDAQHNPNQNVPVSQLNENFIEITLKRNRSGHYVSSGLINGVKTVFLLDTGATYVAIPEHQAKQLGLKKGRVISLSTANGQSRGYQTKIDKLSIGPIHLYHVKAVITPGLQEILLGMSVLKQLEFSQRGKQLTIRQFLQ